MRNTRLGLAALGAAAVLVASGGTMAVAAETETDLLDTIYAAAPDLREGGVAEARSHAVELPTSTASPITLATRAGKTIEIHLPQGNVAAKAASLDGSAVAYNNGDGSTTVPILQGANGVAVHTVIAAAEAPEAYTYRITIPEGAVARQVENGGIVILDGEGGWIAGIAAPWARDSKGVDVPTHYEFDGGALTQVVEHSGDGFAYPIVADPYAGVDVIGSWSWSNYNTANERANIGTTPQMAVAWAAGAAYTAGWPEAKSKMGSRLNTETYRQQFKCHADNAPLVLFGGIFYDGDNFWNLERNRGTNSNYGDVFAHQCNW